VRSFAADIGYRRLSCSYSYPCSNSYSRATRSLTATACEYEYEYRDAEYEYEYGERFAAFETKPDNLPPERVSPGATP
jgi:hypothetical protein